MIVRPVEWSVHVRNCRARLPFRFGIHTLTAAPLCLLRLEAETEDGARAEGYASDLLVPKWFEKDPLAPVEQDWAGLLGGVREVADLAVGESAHATPFEHWCRLYEAHVRAVPPGAPDRLRRGHAVSLVERALIDVACRHADLPLADAISADLLGFRPGQVASDLGAAGAGWPAEEQRPTRVAVRHTIGLLDALSDDQIPAGARVGDGLPESLSADIDRYGLRYFKMKVAGAPDEVARRIAAVARVVRDGAGDGARFTLDGNEQYRRVAELSVTLDAARADPDGAWLLDRVLFVEQPLHRAHTFDPAACAGIDALDGLGGCVIDEADDDVDALPRAAALGYRGVSVKNCKGVFRAMINRLRCLASAGTLIQSGEDLTNVPVVALQQDLATMEALGIPHVERNGHHYFRGLDHLPDADQREALARHPDLYERVDRGVQLAIRDGSVSVESVRAAHGFGYDGPVALDDWIPLDDWSPEPLLGDAAVDP